MKKIFMVIIGISLMHYVSNAAFMDLGAGARPSAMGKAFVGVSDDSDALYYNNAGLYQIKRPCFISMYSRLYADIAGLYEISSGFVLPLGEKYGSIGLRWNSLNVTEESGGAGYYEHIIGFAYGYPIHKTIELGDNEVGLGFGVKLLGKLYSANEWTDINPVFSKTNVWAVGIDVSLMYKPVFLSKNLCFGFSIENINQPDMGISSEDKIPSLTRTGVSYLLLNDILLSTEITFRDNKIKYNGGIEVSALDSFKVRAGYSFDKTNYKNLSAGFGYSFSYFLKGEVSYAFILPFNFVDNTLGTHRISLNLLF